MLSCHLILQRIITVQNRLLPCHFCSQTMHLAITSSRKDGSRPVFNLEQGSRKGPSCLAFLSRMKPDREANFSDRSRITADNEGRQTGPPLSPLDLIQWILRTAVCSKRRRAGDLLSACLKHVKPAGTSPYCERTSENLVRCGTDIVECSRKKSRCPGEKPACSLCTRLKQTCVYADDGSMPEVRSAAIERRMVSLLLYTKDS